MNEDITRITVDRSWLGVFTAEVVVTQIEAEISSGQRVEVDLSRVSSLPFNAARILLEAQERYQLVAFVGMDEHVDAVLAHTHASRKAAA